MNFVGEKGTRTPIGRWVRLVLRAEPWLPLILAFAIMIGYFWFYRTPSVAMVGLNYYFDFCAGSFLFLLVFAARRIQLSVKNYFESRYGLPQNVLLSRRRFWPWLIVIAGTTWAMLWFQLPLHASFYFSQTAFDRLAEEALANPSAAHQLTGRRAGLYEIEGVEVLNKSVVFYLGKDKGTYGFVCVPTATCNHIYNQKGNEDNPNCNRDFPHYEFPNDRVGDRIMGDWFVMYSSYWNVKVGWS